MCVVHVHVIVTEVCTWGVCPWSNPEITRHELLRPSAVRRVASEREQGMDSVRRRSRESSTTEITKDDFQWDESNCYKIFIV